MDQTIAELTNKLQRQEMRLNFLMMVMTAPDSFEAQAYDKAIVKLGYAEQLPKDWAMVKTMLTALVDCGIEIVAAGQADVVDAMARMGDSEGDLARAPAQDQVYQNVANLYPM